MKDLSKKVEEWIHKGGFPLEMRVANSFIKCGFDVAQSVYYVDDETKKYRETDIIASKYKSINGIWVNLTFVIECKSSNDKPWVILVNNGLKGHYGDQLPVYSTRNGNNFMEATKSFKEFKSDLFFKNSRSIGYSMVTAFNNGTDRSYEAIQSVTKACEYFMSECNEKRKNQCNFYFPIVFVEGLLFNATLTEKGEINIDQVKGSELLITRSFHTFGNAALLVFDSSELDSTAKHLERYCDEIFKNYSDLLKEKINTVQAKK